MPDGAERGDELVDGVPLRHAVDGADRVAGESEDYGGGTGGGRARGRWEWCRAGPGPAGCQAAEKKLVNQWTSLPDSLLM